MKAIVFGGSGFVGQVLVKKLIEQNYEVIIGDIRKPLEELCTYMNIDIRNMEELQKLDYNVDDIIINLAAVQYHEKVPRKNRQQFFDNTNTIGTENILKIMYENKCGNYIMVSTDMTYGKPKFVPLTTGHKQEPFGPYGESKLKAEMICRKYREKGINVTIFRPRMIMGPGRLGILKKLFVLMDLGLPIPTIGKGNNCYQMISVFDCVEAIMQSIKKGIPNSEYNLGSKNPPSVKKLLQDLVSSVSGKSKIIGTPANLVKMTLSLLGKIGVEIMYKEQYMIADEEYILDTIVTEKELDWTPLYNDQDMIIQAYKEYKSLKKK